MKTLDIILIVVIICGIYILYTDYTYTRNNFDENVLEPVKYIKKENKQIIENLTAPKIDYYPINFTLSSTVSYVPDDCLPLNFAYNPISKTLLLNGNGKIVATDTSLNSISASSPIKINLILTKAGQTDVHLSLSDIKFEVSLCNTNPSITLQKLKTAIPTFLNSTYDSVSGNITIGIVAFTFNQIVFGTTETLANNKPNFVVPTVCDIKSCKSTTTPISQSSNLSPIISAPLNAIDELVENKKIFALYTKISKNDGSKDLFKVYLTSLITPDSLFNTCDTKHGMFTFTTNLLQGSVFQVRKSIKKIPFLDIPYKYLDFYNVESDENNENKICYSVFYNLMLKYNNHSLSYCLRGCDENNASGLCAQEDIKISIIKDSQFMETPETKDNYSLKNNLKFKFESDGSVTPYFLSYSNSVEKIYFITNKFNSVNNPNAYKIPVQIPTYGKQGPYFELPDTIVNDGVTIQTTKEEPITGLNIPYSPTQIKDYFERVSLPPEETKAFLNDAYKNYALKFFIEEIDPNKTDITTLPMKE